MERSPEYSQNFTTPYNHWRKVCGFADSAHEKVRGRLNLCCKIPPQQARRCTFRKLAIRLVLNLILIVNSSYFFDTSGFRHFCGRINKKGLSQLVVPLSFGK